MQTLQFDKIAGHVTFVWGSGVEAKAKRFDLALPFRGIVDKGVRPTSFYITLDKQVVCVEDFQLNLQSLIKMCKCVLGRKIYKTDQTTLEQPEAATDKSLSALETQVAGKHYKNLAIQPVEYCQKNRLDFCESSIIKYATRHKHKNGRQDVLKIIHFAELLLELEYPQTEENDDV